MLIYSSLLFFVHVLDIFPLKLIAAVELCVSCTCDYLESLLEENKRDEGKKKRKTSNLFK